MEAHTKCDVSVTAHTHTHTHTHTILQKKKKNLRVPNFALKKFPHLEKMFLDMMKLWSDLICIVIFCNLIMVLLTSAHCVATKKKFPPCQKLKRNPFISGLWNYLHCHIHASQFWGMESYVIAVLYLTFLWDGVTCHIEELSRTIVSLCRSSQSLSRHH
jgi:hypothetical protein